MFYEMQKVGVFFMELCLSAFYWLETDCGAAFGESSKKPGGRCQSPSPAFVLAPGGAEFQVTAGFHLPGVLQLPVLLC